MADFTIDEFAKKHDLTLHSLASKLGIDRQTLNYYKQIGNLVRYVKKTGEISIIKPSRMTKEKVMKTGNIKNTRVVL